MQNFWSVCDVLKVCHWRKTIQWFPFLPHLRSHGSYPLNVTHGSRLWTKIRLLVHKAFLELTVGFWFKVLICVWRSKGNARGTLAEGVKEIIVLFFYYVVLIESQIRIKNSACFQKCKCSDSSGLSSKKGLKAQKIQNAWYKMLILYAVTIE